MTRTAARIFLPALLLLAFGLRVYLLDFQELRGDEAFGYFFSLRPYGEIVSATLELREPHPVAGYFVQKAWIGLAGRSEFALRYVSAWFGVLAVALIYRFGRRLKLTTTVATVAALLLAVSPYLIWHAQDARMYSMSLALTLASTWLAVEWLDCETPRRRWLWALAYILVSWLALQTHYFAAFVLIAQYLYVVGWTLWRRRWRTLGVWLLLQGIVFLSYLPWLARASATLAGYGGNGDSPGLFEMAQRSLAVFAGGESAAPQQGIGLALLALLLLALGTWRLLRHGPTTRPSALLLWLYLAVPLLATWASSLQRPIFNERYLAAAAPPFYLLIASVLLPPAAEGVGRRRQLFRYTGAALLLLFTLGAVVSLNRHYHDPAYSKTRGWRELSSAIDRYSAGLLPEAVRIAQNFPDPTLWYYYDGPVEHVVLPPSPHDGEGATAVVSSLAQEGVQRVILPLQPGPNWDDAGIAATALAEAYSPIHEEQVGVWPVAVYDLAGRALSPAAFEFENGVRIAGLNVTPVALEPGGLLSVRVRWQGEAGSLAGDEKVTVQLLGPAGQVVAQEDRTLDAGQIFAPSATADAYGMLLPMELEEGEYRLIVALYVPIQAGSRRIPTATGEEAATIWQFLR